MKSTTHRRTAGFTLTELLVVILIIIVLAALLFSVVSRTRERARAAVCAQNLKQIGVGLLSHITENNGRFPDGSADVSWLWDPVEKRFLGLCWYDAAAKNMGRESFSMRFNDPAADPLPDAFGCPSGHGRAYHPQWPYTGDYAANVRLGSPSINNPVTRVSAVKNPASTPYVQDTVKQNNFGEWIFRSGASKEANAAFADRHGGKGNILWVDGHVSSFTYSEYMAFANKPSHGGVSNFIRGDW